MVKPGLEQEMYESLLKSERRLRAERHDITRRALIYMEMEGLPLDRVLEALGISRATWYRRVQDLRQTQQ